uniref:Dyp-type peroxidase C-terminal domain-containing protein n=1 Tax=Schistosoma mansoni TaxID=6183 RepID=A0A5K4FC36_SCHMA
MLFDLADSIIQNMPPGCMDKFEDIYGWIYHDRRDLSEFVDDGEKERWIGRTIKDSYELIRKPDTSHVARMVGSAEFKAKKKYRIVRQAQPYGTLSGGAGLLFIAYAADIDNFNFMLDRMTGHSGDKKNDNIMVFSRCVTGNYWYFPGLLEFNLLVRNLPRGIRL